MTLQPLTLETFETLEIAPAYTHHHRPMVGKKAMPREMRKARERAKKKSERCENIAILDFETEPFDHIIQQKIEPFLAVLYSDNFDPVVIWEENVTRFVSAVLKAITDLPGRYTIYAHNGGKFDYMFLLHRLRGAVMFKGRGLMSARIGEHEIRDSFHIIPERLANFNKDDIDYSWMKKAVRNKHRKEIIEYCIKDCVYLLDIVKKFIDVNGLKLSIGQASMAYLRKEYKFDRLGDTMDSFLRQFFFGGRVECLAGKGHWTTGHKLYDVNSMYPDVMARYQHPIGNNYTVSQGGRIGANCCFIVLSCNNYGALVRRGEDNETNGNFRDGMFFTTIHEYRVAKKYKLIDNVRIIYTVNCDRFSDFSRVIVPLYENRIKSKGLLKTLTKDSYEYNEAKKDDMIMKFLLNNMYGKFAQNPRRYKEHYITSPDEIPPDTEKGYGPLPAYECNDYWIWERPNPSHRFNNVGTAASITGAARSVLLEAIQNSVDPIYCDTDSLICKSMAGVEIDGSKLGAWDIEQEFDEVIITGKKQYACKVKGVADGHKDRTKIRSKGVSDREWNDFVKMLDGEIIDAVNHSPTFTKTGQQFYMRRKIRATAPTLKHKGRSFRERVFA